MVNTTLREIYNSSQINIKYKTFYSLLCFLCFEMLLTEMKTLKKLHVYKHIIFFLQLVRLKL